MSRWLRTLLRIFLLLGWLGAAAVPALAAPPREPTPPVPPRMVLFETFLRPNG